ncbi:hypothetical protein SLPG_00026 [Salicola phage CGphi29]|uniref:hypothetical protein n=1 Tax=Salicola phage CGphi29 TaxID=754067 RepID=UPI0002C04828|nr:hypothetical protein SLPG_00026 [Salicola phage CGphi29]AGH31820.1 hypothetical protein SLPG_00026 [Salicola phage CGphi29]
MSVYRGADVPAGTRAFVNGIEIDRALAAKVGESGWVEFTPGQAKVKRPERDCVYTRAARGDVHIELPSGEVIRQ